MSEKSYRFTISIPNNPANADLINKLQRMENGARSRFTRSLMEDGFKFRDEAGIERYYGVFFVDEEPTAAPATASAPKAEVVLAKNEEKPKRTPRQASESKKKDGSASSKKSILDQNLNNTLNIPGI